MKNLPIGPIALDSRGIVFVETLGGKVTRDENAPGKPIVRVNLSKTAVTDAGLKELASLKNLTILSLFSTEVTDAGVQKLRQALPKCLIRY